MDELELASGEDAPMSMASHPETSDIVGGINSSEDALKTSPNQNCRVYNVKEKKYASNLPFFRYQFHLFYQDNFDGDAEHACSARYR